MITKTSSVLHTIGSVTKSVSYGYNQAGALTSLTYPSGHVVSYAYSSAGRPTSAVNGTSIYYVTSATYTPGGAVAGYHNGSSITVSNTYNNRLQPEVLKAYVSTASPPDIYGFDYNFVDGSGHNNGNVQQIVNLKDSNYTQNFTYDELNRIQQGYSSGSSWGETFTIDPWGNLTNRGGVTGKTYYEPLNAAPATGTNQLNGYSYDAAGNLTNDGTSYSYDAESRLSSTSGYTYTYDGDGQRVKKSNGSTGTLYWMGAGNVLGESDLSGSMQYEYVFFNGKRVARRDISTGNVHYYFADHLGSTRVTTSASGSIEKVSDYSPYGGEIFTSGSDPNHYKFTGKERDSESGLDNFGARYHGSNLGRFMTPDPENAGAEPDDPQSWNGYTYSLNNPLLYVDPDGKEPCVNGVNPENGNICTIVTEKPKPKMDKGGVNPGFLGPFDILFVRIPNFGIMSRLSEMIGIGEKTAVNTAAGVAEKTAVSRAEAAALRSEVQSVLSRAASTAGNQEMRVGSREAAEQAAKEWVGPGAKPLLNRTTGAEVGLRSADGSKIARFTSTNKPQPYVNLVNVNTGGNLHVRF